MYYRRTRRRAKYAAQGVIMWMTVLGVIGAVMVLEEVCRVIFG